MAPDLIRCPGCGVKMDLSTFAIRPDQVVCPRCSTRAVVPPKSSTMGATSQAGAMQSAQGAPPQNSFAQSMPVGAAAPSSFAYSPASSYNPYISPQAYSAQVFTAPTPTFTVPLAASSMPIALQPVSMPLPTQVPVDWYRGYGSGMQAPVRRMVAPGASLQAPLSAQGAAGVAGVAGAAGAATAAAQAGSSFLNSPPNEFTMPKGGTRVAQQPSKQQNGSKSSAQPVAQSSSSGSVQGILPIDQKGNVEPLAFAIIGLFTALSLFPPIGIVLCILALRMVFEERAHGLHNSHRGATVGIALIGLIVNLILLVFEISYVIPIIMNPPAYLSLFL